MDQQDQKTGFVFDPGSYVMPKPDLATQPTISIPGQTVSPPPPVQGFQLDLGSYVVPKVGGVEEAIPTPEPKPSFAKKALGTVGGALADVGQAAAQEGKTVLGGFYGGASRTAGLLEKASDWISRQISSATGIPYEKLHGGVFGQLQNNWDYYSQKFSKEGIQLPVIREVLAGLGQAGWDIPGIMAFGPYGLTVKGAAEGLIEEGVKGAVLGGVEGALTHNIIKGIGVLPSKAQIPAWFGVGAATTPGNLKDRTVGGLTWAALGVTGRKGKVTVNDFLENYPKLKNRIDEGHAWKAIREIAPELSEADVAAAGGPKAALANAIAYKDKVVSLMAAFQKAGVDPIKMMQNPRAAEIFGKFILEGQPAALPPAARFEATAKGTVFKAGTPEPVKLKVEYREAEGLDPYFALNEQKITREAVKAAQTAIKKQPQINKIMEDVSKEFGLKYIESPKKASSIVSKIYRRNDPTFTTKDINDLIRGTILVKDWSQIPDVVSALRKRGAFTFEDTFNGEPKLLGFRGINLNADFGEGVRGEIQLHTKETYDFKKQVSDPIYQKWRKYQRGKVIDAPKELRAEYDANDKRVADYYEGVKAGISQEVLGLFSNMSSASFSESRVASIKSPKVPKKGTQEPPSSTSALLPPPIGEVSTTLPSSSLPKERLGAIEKTSDLILTPETPPVKIVKPEKTQIISKTPLIDFIRKKGGISLKSSEEAAKWRGEYKDLRQSRYWNIFRNKGLGPDHMAEQAKEAGYIQEEDGGALLNAIKLEIAGKPQYSRKTRQAEQALEAEKGPTKEQLEDVEYTAKQGDLLEQQKFAFDLFLDGQKLDYDTDKLARERLMHFPEEEIQKALETRRLNQKRNELLEKTGYTEKQIKEFMDNLFLDGEEARKTAKKVLDKEITEEEAVKELKGDIEVASAAVEGTEFIEPAGGMEHAGAPVSQEAINRKNNVEFFMYDARSKSVQPIPAADAVDVQPKKNEIKVERNKNSGELTFFRGEDATTPTHLIEKVLPALKKPEKAPEIVGAKEGYVLTKEEPKPEAQPAMKKEALAEDTVYMAARNADGDVIATLSQVHDGTYEGMIDAGRELVAKAEKEAPGFSRAESSFMVTDETGELKYSISPNLRHINDIKPGATLPEKPVVEEPAVKKTPPEEKPFSLTQEVEAQPKAKAPAAKQEQLFTEVPERAYPAGFDNRGIRKWRDIQTFRTEIQPVLNEGYVVEYGHDKGKDVWARIIEKKEPGDGRLARNKSIKVPEFGKAEAEQLAITEEEKSKELFVGEKEPEKKESWEKRLEEEPKKEEEGESDAEFDKWYRDLQEGYDKEIKKVPQGKVSLVRIEVKTPDGQLEQLGNLPEDRVEAIRKYAQEHGQGTAVTIGKPFFGKWEESLTPKEQERYIKDFIRAAEETPASEWKDWYENKGELFSGIGIALPKRARMILQKGLDKLDVEASFKRLGAKETGLALKLYHPRRNAELDKGIKAAKELTKKFKGLDRADFERLTLLASKERKFDELTPAEQAKYREPLKVVREFFDKYSAQLQKLAVIEEPWPYSAIRRMRLELQNYREALKLGVKDSEKVRKEIRNRELAIDFLEKAKVRYVHIPRFWLETFWEKNRDQAPKILTEFFHERKTLDLEQLANYLLKGGYIKKSDMDVRKIMLAYSHFAGHKISLSEIFENAKKEGLVKTAGDTPDTWVPLQPRRFPTLKGMRMHPELVDYIERNFLRRGAEWVPPFIGNVMGSIKALQFYNPFNLSQYSAVQTMWTGSLTSVKAPKIAVSSIKSMLKKDADYQEAAYWGAFSEPFTPTFRQAERRIEKFMTQSPFKKALKYANPYELSWTMAWWFENAFKMMSYKGLKAQGFAPKEAAQIAAKTGADYASIPPATRKVLNKILFTPSFTISMVKTQSEMMAAGAKILSHPKLLTAKTPEAKYSRVMARGALLLAGGIAAREALMHALGYKTDRFGIKYYKTIEDEEGNKKELVVHIPTPDNVILRYAFDLASIGKADNQLEELGNRAKWKLHPLWQLGIELLSKKRADGEPLIDPTKSDRAEIVRDVLLYTVRRVLRISELIPEGGEGSLSKVKAFKAMQDDLGKLGGSILSAYSIPYIRNPKERRLMYQMNELLNFFKQMTKARPPKNEEEADKASKWLQKKLEEFQKRFEEVREEEK